MAVALVGCEGTGSSSRVRLETDAQKASYGIGRDVGRNLEPASEKLDMDAFLRGMHDQFEGRDPALPDEEIMAATQRFTQAVQQEQQAQREAQGEENKTAGDAFLAENAEKEDVTTTESGLQYEVLEEGNGRTADSTDIVTLHYEGKLIDGTVFDSSHERGEPATFSVGRVIPGLSEGLQLMPVGSTYRFVIPPDLGYGERGAGQQIGPNATLVFEVELMRIQGDSTEAGGDSGS
jgi:FKBP-type peptidyl-prolyl cis-trans isomerase